MEIAFSILQTISVWILFALLLGGEYLDAYGRLDVLEVKHPRTHRFVTARPVRLVLLLLLFGLLVGISKEQRVELEGVKDPPPMKFVAPKPPEIAKTQFIEAANSLRRRTIRLATEIETFWNDYPPSPGGPPSNPTTDEELQRKATWDKYWRDAQLAYDGHSFDEKLAGIIGEYQQKGVATGFLDADIKYHRMLGGPRPQYTVGNVPCCNDELCQLKELAFHVSAQDVHITPADIMQP